MEDRLKYCQKGKLYAERTNRTVSTIPCEEIGNTTYIVNVHFKENAKETLQQKINRMLKDEVKYSA